MVLLLKLLISQTRAIYLHKNSRMSHSRIIYLTFSMTAHDDSIKLISNYEGESCNSTQTHMISVFGFVSNNTLAYLYHKMSTLFTKQDELLYFN